jgi:hypothetical protein
MGGVMSEPTLTEILRRLDELSQDVKEIPLRVQEEFVRREVYASERTHLDDRVRRLESRSEWLVRTIGALVIGLIFGISIMLGK